MRWRLLGPPLSALEMQRAAYGKQHPTTVECSTYCTVVIFLYVGAERPCIQVACRSSAHTIAPVMGADQQVLLHTEPCATGRRQHMASIPCQTLD